jgi:hypothetical protein
MIGETRGCTSADRTWWAIGLWVGLALLDLVVSSRSLLGAMTAALSAPLAIGGTVILATTAIAALILWRRDHRATIDWRDWWPELTAIGLPLAWVLVISRGTTPLAQGGLIACGGLLIAAAGLVSLWGVKEEVCETASDRRGDMAQGMSTLEGATQWQKRLIVDGREMIEGEVSVDFAAGQKEAVVHLSFCPPLASSPEIHAEDGLGGDVEIRAEASHPYGARLILRRRGDISHPETRQISYAATQAETSDAAA